MYHKDLYGVITGCNRGIGLSILKTMSESGANIFACVRNVSQDFINLTKKIEIENNNKIEIIELDLKDETSVRKAVSNINNLNKEINFLVNNSGIIHNKLFQMTKIEEFYEVFKINFFNQVLLTQGLIRNLIKKKNGSIVFLSSSAAKDGNFGRSVYSSSKSAISSFAKVLSRELGQYGIRVNSISPGLTDTEMMTNSTSIEYLNDIIKNIPLKRIGVPVDISNLVSFLVSDNSKYITGQDFRIDGGLV